MRFTLPCFTMILFASTLQARAGEPEFRDLYADTWVGTDALGRTMPTSTEVGPVKTDHLRAVSMFYITWHSDSMAGLKGPYGADVTRILAKDPAARLDAKNPLWTEGMYHWVNRRWVISSAKTPTSFARICPCFPTQAWMCSLWT